MERGNGQHGIVGEAAQERERIAEDHLVAGGARHHRHRRVQVDAARAEAMLAEHVEPLAAAAAQVDAGPVAGIFPRADQKLQIVRFQLGADAGGVAAKDRFQRQVVARHVRVGDRARAAIAAGGLEWACIRTRPSVRACAAVALERSSVTDRRGDAVALRQRQALRRGRELLLPWLPPPARAHPVRLARIDRARRSLRPAARARPRRAAADCVCRAGPRCGATPHACPGATTAVGRRSAHSSGRSQSGHAGLPRNLPLFGRRRELGQDLEARHALLQPAQVVAAAGRVCRASQAGQKRQLDEIVGIRDQEMLELPRAVGGPCIQQRAAGPGVDGRRPAANRDPRRASAAARGRRRRHAGVPAGYRCRSCAIAAAGLGVSGTRPRWAAAERQHET